MKPLSYWIYAEKPLNVYWEVTRACDLACRHCRAEAIKERHPSELTTEEGKRVLREVREFGDSPPRVILTGGDPLKRQDLFDLIDYGITLGLKISITPSGTDSLTKVGVRRHGATPLQELKRHGIESIALSLDGSSPEKHDSLRGVPGCFARTLKAAAFASDTGLPFQINTLVTGETLSDLPSIYEIVKTLGTNRWSLFFLIPVGRGISLKEVTPEECEKLFHWLYLITKESPFTIATTEAPHFRRFALSKMREENNSREKILKTSIGRSFGIRDGNGILFISHTGEVFPAGFLPVSAGNIRKEGIVEIYQNSPVFVNLRNPGRLKGKCGLCEYKMICGGSRARAYARTFEYLESDPLCSYEPRKKQKTFTIPKLKTLEGMGEVCEHPRRGVGEPKRRT